MVFVRLLTMLFIYGTMKWVSKFMRIFTRKLLIQGGAYMRVILLFLFLISSVAFAEFVTELAITPSISIPEIQSENIIGEVNFVSAVSTSANSINDINADITFSPASSQIAIPEPRFLYFLLLYFMLINYRRLV